MISNLKMHYWVLIKYNIEQAEKRLYTNHLWYQNNKLKFILRSNNEHVLQNRYVSDLSRLIFWSAQNLSVNGMQLRYLHHSQSNKFK